MKKAIVISLTLFACSVQANNLCSLNSGPAEKKIKIKGVPGYFFKVHPDGDYLTFIESDHNTLLNLNTGAELPTVGTIDPVWSPDGKFLTHPGMSQQSPEGGLQFYPAKEILEATKKSSLTSIAPQDSELSGVYQSIGVKKDGNYRIVSDKNGVSIAEYSYSASGPKLLSNIERPCQNISDFGTDLPMISKDGRYLSAYDKNSKSTKIFKLNGRSCDLALDLGFGTGKVSFNPDSSQIAFHVDQFSDFQEGYFSGVGKDKVKNVVVLNLEETADGKLKPTAWAMASQHTKPGDGGYYPDFDKNGNIYYMEDMDNNFQIVKVSPKSLEFRTMEKDLLFGKTHPTTCDDSSTDILAKMWKEVCSKDNPIAIDQYREFTMAIDPVECKKMVENFYVPSLKVSKDDLLKSCPQKVHAPAQPVGEWNPNQKVEAEALLKGKCLSCHKQQKTYEATDSIYVLDGPSSYSIQEMTYKKKLPAFNMDKMDAGLAREMLGAIMSGKMPKKEPLAEQQKKSVTDYLQKRLLDLPAKEEASFQVVRRYSEANLAIERDLVLKANPNLTPEIQTYFIKSVNCMYGQKDCDSFLELHSAYVVEDAKKLPEEDRGKYVKDKMLEVKCANLIGVTPQDCKDWSRNRK